MVASLGIVLGGKVNTGEHKNGGRRNVRKHREFNNGEKYITLEISLDFGSPDKLKVISPEPQIIRED